MISQTTQHKKIKIKKSSNDEYPRFMIVKTTADNAPILVKGKSEKKVYKNISAIRAKISV